MDYIFASINDLASYFENQATLLRSHAKRKRSSRERESTLAAASTYENVAHIIRNTKIENVSLIAAASDLLAMLKEAVVDRHLDDDWWRRAHRAIAKAEGTASLSRSDLQRIRAEAALIARNTLGLGTDED